MSFLKHLMGGSKEGGKGRGGAGEHRERGRFNLFARRERMISYVGENQEETTKSLRGNQSDCACEQVVHRSLSG